MRDFVCVLLEHQRDLTRLTPKAAGANHAGVDRVVDARFLHRT